MQVVGMSETTTPSASFDRLSVLIEELTTDFQNRSGVGTRDSERDVVESLSEGLEPQTSVRPECACWQCQKERHKGIPSVAFSEGGAHDDH